jgi:hypothetical protein
MADDKQSGPGLGGNSIILLVAAASAAYFAWQKPPLEGFRPTELGPQIHDNRGIQDVDARLWQDPLAAVTMHIQSEREDKLKRAQSHSNFDSLPATTDGADNEQSDKSKPDNFHRISEFLDDFKARNRNDNQTLLIGVTLPGAPYPEDSEERRRLRYAVLAALHVEKYVPDDEEHIGFVETDDTEPAAWKLRSGQSTTTSAVKEASSNASRGDHPPVPAVVPFEWFNSVDKPRQHVVIFWIDESVLAAGRQPIESLDLLRRKLQLTEGRFAVLGPHASTTLTAMVRENRDPKMPRLSLYNYGATTDDTMLLQLANVQEKRIKKGDIEEYFSKQGIDYYRTINSDDTLAKALVAELERRNVDPNRTVIYPSEGDPAKTKFIHPDHIALISEWDTVYGQMLPELITRVFDQTAYIAGERPLDYPSWIMPFSYLRGLDGQLPSSKSPKDEKSSDNGGNASKTDARSTNSADQIERAEGQSQFDYLRRLADHVRQRDEELRQSNEGHIAAIGVLGSDVYDKLLILQALRPEFPEALFFTTDLDAELLSQSKSRYVRNVIVASSYDLKLRDALQADIPPFWSTYQTSIFLTARLAIENGWTHTSADNPDARANISLLSTMARPRLFQIGRTGAYALPVDPADLSRDPSNDDCVRNILDCSSVQPHVRKLFPELKRGALVSLVLLVTALLIGALMSSRNLRQFCFLSKTAHDASQPTIAQRVIPIAILSLVALIISIGLCVSWPTSQGLCP